MANVTLSIKDDFLKKSRKYAQKRGKSLNSLIRELLSKEIENNYGEEWIEECFKLMDKAGGNSKGWKWNRDEIYER